MFLEISVQKSEGWVRSLIASIERETDRQTDRDRDRETKTERDFSLDFTPHNITMLALSQLDIFLPN